MKDESGEQFVAYFLPTDETMQKRDKDKEDGMFLLLLNLIIPCLLLQQSRMSLVTQLYYCQI